MQEKQQPPVAIFTTVGCGFCKQTKDALSKANINFLDIELSRQLELLNEVKQITGQRTVPQVCCTAHFIFSTLNDNLLVTFCNRLKQYLPESIFWCHGCADAWAAAG